MTPPIPARLMVLFAPEAPLAVIYRQGPTQWTQMWLWNTETDVFVPGQWIKGRVKEHSSLSPDGRYVISRIMSGDQHTVLSRPPYFSALAVNVNGLCLVGTHFLKDGGVVGQLGEYRAPKSRCPLTFWQASQPWSESFLVDNSALYGGEEGQDQRGRVVAVSLGRIGVVENGETRWLIDLNPYRPENVPPPDWALDW